MTNTKLLNKATVADFIKMGFVEEKDGSGSPWGTDWNIRNEKYHLQIDPTFQVTLCRINPDTDPITIMVDDLPELQSVVDWIAD